MHRRGGQPPAAFLWPTGEVPPPSAYALQPGGWWHQFSSGLITQHKLTPAAFCELERTSRAIAGALANPSSWDRPRPWKGLIVGAIQSGKTMSMMGVTALALDAGYKIVIILAGLKNDLREQTARRFNTQLMLQNDIIPNAGGATTLGGPLGPRGVKKGYAPPFYLDSHENSVLSAQLAASLRKGLPGVIVIKKLPLSIYDMQGALGCVYGEFGPISLPTLILDDECDDASVPGGTSAEERVVPEAIRRLWSAESEFRPNMTYLGYTATSAANLLQDPYGPLYPHFVSLLRFPAATASPIRFEEPSADDWYSGGDCFYFEFGEELGDDSNFLISPTIEQCHLESKPHYNGSLWEAFRAFFVGGAYRLALEPDRDFSNPTRLPRPYSMMIHTSVSQEDHSLWLDGVLEMFGRRDLPDGSTGLDPEKLSSILSSEEAEWRAWYERFNRSRMRIHETRPHSLPYESIPWESVRRQLAKVFNYVRIKAVNSDAEIGDSLSYEPGNAQDGAKTPPQDIYVIAIGGSRLSRGITVEGLGITYFARWSVQRHEDTILQMSRWFGYRGPFLEFCRLFVTTEAWEGFRNLNANDIALRMRLAELMNEKKDPAYATIIFRASPYVLPTAKLGAGTIHDLTFSPFTSTFSDARFGCFDQENEEMALNLIQRIRARNPRRIFTRNGVQRGILSPDWDTLEVADLLDSLKFQAHNPAPKDCLLGDYFRPPDMSRPLQTNIAPELDPYHVAAYLRHWVITKPNGAAPPHFNVGVSFGEMTQACDPFDIPLSNRKVSAEDQIEGGWTGRSGYWDGDYYFDGVPPELRKGPTQRASGSPGLLLLYIVHKDATGRANLGKKRRCHTPFFGISIPSGGPAVIRVVAKKKG